MYVYIYTYIYIYILYGVNDDNNNANKQNGNTNIDHDSNTHSSCLWEYMGIVSNDGYLYICNIRLPGYFESINDIRQMKMIQPPTSVWCKWVFSTYLDISIVVSMESSVVDHLTHGIREFCVLWGYMVVHMGFDGDLK